MQDGYPVVKGRNQNGLKGANIRIGNFYPMKMILKRARQVLNEALPFDF